MTASRATEIAAAPGAEDRIALTYEARLLRRKRLTSVSAREVVVDFPATISVGHGEAFVLDDGGRIVAREALIEVTRDLPRLAGYIGNRHTPCQIGPDRLLIQHDHVLAEMLARLGATVRDMTEPFCPEGGAYGHGRTMGHDHGHDRAADRGP